MRFVWTIGILLCGQMGLAQQNLVPNPSFEIIEDCPHTAVSILEAPPWRKVGGDGGVPLFHECGWNGFGVPENLGGHQNARTGVAYADVINWIAPIEELILEGNFIGVPLDSTLIAGHKYLVEFHVNLLDSMLYSTRNIGAHFSAKQPSDDIEIILGLEPQVQYLDSSYLSNKEGWMRISGDFIAEGGESFLTIGNFNGHYATDTLYIGGVTPSPGGAYTWEAAYYYLDDVSVVLDTSYHVGVDDQLAMGNEQLSVFPNPARDVVSVKLQAAIKKPMRLVVYDAMGREIDCRGRASLAMTGALELDVGSWENGVYMVNLWDDMGTVHRQKLIVQH